MLKNRVSFLERALRKARQKPAELPVIAARRDQAEADERRQALKEYNQRSTLELYKRSPWLLEGQQRSEDERNDFLRSRGLTPEPTQIPPELRRRARSLVDSAGRKLDPFVTEAARRTLKRTEW